MSGDGIDWVLRANAKAKGKRPHYFEDPAIDRTLSIVMALVGEVSVPSRAAGHGRAAAWKRRGASAARISRATRLTGMLRSSAARPRANISRG
jgi:hypothetical protein